MNEIKLWGTGIARVWLNEFVPLSTLRRANLNHQIPAEKSQLKTTSAVVEIFIPMGASFLYGVLGGKAESPTKDNLFEIQINCEPEGNDDSFNSLAVGIDQLSVGLSRENSDVVLATLSHRALEIGAAKITIDRAYEGEIGSSVRAFKILSEALLICFLTPDLSNDAEAFREKLKSCV